MSPTPAARPAAASRPLGLALATSVLALAMALPGAAQSRDGRTTLLDFLDPDRIAARLLQMGIAGLRTQADIVYGTLTTSVTGGSATITDLTIWPMVDWDVAIGCEIRIDRLRLNGVPLDNMDQARLKLALTGGSISSDCLPPDMRAQVVAVTGEQLEITRALFDIDYRIPDSSAQVQIQLTLAGQAAISAVLDMDYVWMDASARYRDPLPVVFLNSARVTLDNLGLWENLQPMLPPMVTDAAQYGPLIDQGLRMMGSRGAPPSAQRGPLAESVKAAWGDFIANPRRLVLETGFADGPRLLDFERWDDEGPDALLDDLEPRLTTRSAAVLALPPADLLSKGYDDPSGLSRDEAIRIGTALATGSGAPRDPVQARAVLGPLADAGDGAAALALARLLELRDTEAAYGYALTAARVAAEGSAGVLDRIETALPLARVLEIQHALIADDELPVEALESLTAIREVASASMTGKGRSRSYQLALLWASIGAAAGDAECAEILAEIDALVASADEAARTVWTAHEAAAAELARSAWLNFDLPASFGAGR